MKPFLSVIFLLLIISSCSNKIRNTFSKQYIDPGSNYSKAIAITNGQTTTIYVAGLTGDGNDFETQTRSAFQHIKEVLKKSGAGLKNIIKTNIYITNLTTENVDIFRKVRKELFGEKNMPASTIVGITALAAIDKLIEIEAIAVINFKKVTIKKDDQ